MRSTLPGFNINVNNYQRLKQTFKGMQKKGMNLRFSQRSEGNLIKKMKLLFAFFFTGLLGVSASTYSQQAKFSIKLDGVTVKEAFKQIEKISEFVFFYNEDYIDVSRKVSINASDEKVESILNELLKGTQNSFKIYDRQIVISVSDTKESPTSFGPVINAEQKKELSGTVTDTKGAPIPGVTIVVKGTTTGITTDFEGKFSLYVPADAKTLVFSFVGMKTQELSITGRITFEIVLEEETFGVDEVVVVGYGTQKKSDITGTVSTLPKDRLEMSPNLNIAQAIQGAIPGVMIQTSSAGAAPTEAILIRGRNSITASNDPLIVVDGIPYGGLISDISPNDVKSIEILKDASAAAIYGSRGSNGVILISSKEGRTGKPVISYNGRFSLMTLYQGS